MRRQAIRLLLVLSVPLTVAPALDAQTRKYEPLIVAFDKLGKLEQQAQDLEAQYPKEAPTDILVMAHGWNNAKTQAKQTYEKMAELIQAQVERHPAKPKDFRPLLIGMRWPSLAWEDDAGFDLAVGELENVLKVNVHPKWQKLVAPLLESAERLQNANPLAVKLGLKLIKNQFPELEFDPIALLDAKLLEKKNLAEVIRVFSFYQMKQRAGEVGREGVRPMLIHLQKKFPQSRVHLVGHSFGCKVLLSCLADGDWPRPVDSLVLLQAAVSHEAPAEELPKLGEEKVCGAYCQARKRVRGPIIATFSDADRPLSYAFPLAARAAGHVAEAALKKRELPADAYWALGAKGFGEAGKSMSAKDVWTFAAEFYSIDARTLIAGHNGFQNEDIARLIVSAMFRR